MVVYIVWNSSTKLCSLSPLQWQDTENKLKCSNCSLHLEILRTPAPHPKGMLPKWKRALRPPCRNGQLPSHEVKRSEDFVSKFSPGSEILWCFKRALWQNKQESGTYQVTVWYWTRPVTDTPWALVSPTAKGEDCAMYLPLSF